MSIPFRIGQGLDVHRLVEGRRLVLGGVEIPYEKGLLGHSDADALMHAITDAVLGAVGLGDIGRLFPDTDPANEGADSRKLLQEAIRRVHEAGWLVVNIDAMIIAQAPKISPYASQMVANIAEDIGIDATCVNVKGKTNERLGHLGRGEGIATQAVALLMRRSNT
ncbi:MAG: 2-C-methyl-D-erythritol 2,4-cyclodiphosphate synthase [Candidatus Dactylopiibacterium carminicum]|uniref:2-C-methyl-D-erythritol 2,4-cyclodiphosphate synthase n=1 Tax=Candidatus Dactylopiibacterium carminicum TaxID=857335 RepID=A0A272EQP4_9RHOO|nr:2-C-methyl-D-erythritol 2,4-cyclodiphosphate synthase [Candidatus Dactylopiibacterium carminicum]KAF7599271.1 2-C-methyl-D-erythritol 2,4-cyclodiphosphate synthase [Candidatus Dactylopiibacterium carminicum]PAS92433.1 MAG: 2-C-methyl-D-erythritol 2,4-cyclodiphosphate synthase [Candidatus Dactylopiibacterium carminicum]PAS97179.1 MAG: 2-C-methyl-D-erythritol 2,4-cyclodiphosphate synthase [Candidatus Dactylopiibacterium carminicum]PAS99278.1 MAG: 2-C-methyl-D-erythritol 2,4-cyclodiphosphate sy